MGKNVDDAFNESLKETAEKYGITLPNVRSVNCERIYTPSQDVDYSTLDEINNSIVRARAALFYTTSQAARMDDKLAKAVSVHKKAWRREFLGATGKTEAARKAEADMACENLEDTVLVYGQAKNALRALGYALKLELQSLQTMSGNIRQTLG